MTKKFLSLLLTALMFTFVGINTAHAQTVTGTGTGQTDNTGTGGTGTGGTGTDGAGTGGTGTGETGAVTTVTPGVPDTGTDSTMNMALLLASGVLVIGGVAYLVRRSYGIK